MVELSAVCIKSCLLLWRNYIMQNDAVSMLFLHRSRLSGSESRSLAVRFKRLIHRAVPVREWEQYSGYGLVGRFKVWHNNRRVSDVGRTEAKRVDGHYRFFQNTACEYFPCHQGVDPEAFNCLFCYCPLYALGRACGGACRYNEKGIKDCSACAFPHIRENYPKVIARFGEIMNVVRRSDEENK